MAIFPKKKAEELKEKIAPVADVVSADVPADVAADVPACLADINGKPCGKPLAPGQSFVCPAHVRAN